MEHAKWEVMWKWVPKLFSKAEVMEWGRGRVHAKRSMKKVCVRSMALGHMHPNTAMVAVRHVWGWRRLVAVWGNPLNLGSTQNLESTGKTQKGNSSQGQKQETKGGCAGEPRDKSASRKGWVNHLPQMRQKGIGTAGLPGTTAWPLYPVQQHTWTFERFTKSRLRCEDG